MGGEALDFDYDYKNEWDCFISEILFYKPVFVFAVFKTYCVKNPQDITKFAIGDFQQQNPVVVFVLVAMV